MLFMESSGLSLSLLGAISSFRTLNTRSQSLYAKLADNKLPQPEAYCMKNDTIQDKERFLVCRLQGGSF